MTNPTASIALSGLKAGSVLQLLVENMGRINFSHGMDDDRKGEYWSMLVKTDPSSSCEAASCQQMVDLD